MVIGEVVKEWVCEIQRKRKINKPEYILFSPTTTKLPKMFNMQCLHNNKIWSTNILNTNG